MIFASLQHTEIKQVYRFYLPLDEYVWGNKVSYDKKAFVQAFPALEKRC